MAKIKVLVKRTYNDVCYIITIDERYKYEYELLMIGNKSIFIDDYVYDILQVGIHEIKPFK